MNRVIWTRISIYIGVITIIFAMLDILIIGSESRYNGYGVLAILPLSIVGTVLGMVGSRKEENESFNSGLILNISLLLFVPVYYVLGTLIFGV